MPRLPSGIYFNLRTESTAKEKQYLPEYPIFPVTHHAAEFKRLHVSAEHTGGATVGQNQSRSVPQPPQSQLCLPLLSVSISMQVDCNIAKTNVVQTFTNHGDLSIPEASYSFPLYDGATVIGFRCEVGDDKVLEGKVKPRDEAKREFQRAVKKQEAAALGEEMAPDVFQTTIGNINPRTTVKVEISYVEELLTDLDGDGIAVTIPTSLAPRYGTPPEGYSTNSAVNETGLSLLVNVASPGPIKNIVCRSGHGISVEYGEMNLVSEATSFEALAELQSQADSGLNPKRATARLSINQIAMDRDIVFIIPFPDEVFQKSHALLAPPSGSNHTAMMVTVCPNELFSDLQESMDEFEGEILFLADRSASMSGTKLKQLKDALLVFLKSLPTNCRFNIYSFGNYTSSLWSHSSVYNESTMRQALEHVSTFQADFGGTEVLEALRKAVGDRQSTAVPSTQVVLLTDGEIWQPEQVIDFVRMTTSDSDSHVRFFSLGLGNQVNHQLIKGIGFFGGGFGEAVDIDAHGKWAEALIRMLKGAIMPTSWSYSIKFDKQWKEKRLDMDELFSEGPKGNLHNDLNLIAGAIIPSFVQAPRTIPWVHHFGQQSVYFLLDTTSDIIPDHVLITARSRHGVTKTATLAVTKSASNNDAIQHLAAKAAVRDLEYQNTSGKSPSKKTLKNAERLCQMYSISSKWASFVAVSHLQKSAEYEDVEVSLYKAPFTELDLLTRPSAYQTSANLGIQSGLPMSLNPCFRASSPERELPGADTRSSGAPLRPPTNAMLYDLEYMECELQRGRLDEGEVANKGRSCNRKVSRPSGMIFKTLRSRSNISSAMPVLSKSGLKRSPTKIRKTSSDVQARGQYAISWQEIVRGQHADGLFHLETSLRQYLVQHFCHGTRQALELWLMERVKRPLTDIGEESEAMGLLVDTVMALAYIRSHFYPQRALWDLLVQKAERRLASLLKPGEWERPDGLSTMVDSAVAHAHYGRCSQGDYGGPGWKDSPGSGCCGVCNSQGKARISSGKRDDGFRQCLVSGCDVNLDDWGVFWAHAVEKGHIESSCETAKNRWKQSEAQIREPRVRKLGGIVNLIKSMKFKMIQNAKQGKKV